MNILMRFSGALQATYIRAQHAGLCPQLGPSARPHSCQHLLSLGPGRQVPRRSHEPNLVVYVQFIQPLETLCLSVLSAEQCQIPQVF